MAIERIPDGSKANWCSSCKENRGFTGLHPGKFQLQVSAPKSQVLFAISRSASPPPTTPPQRVIIRTANGNYSNYLMVTTFKRQEIVIPVKLCPHSLIRRRTRRDSALLFGLCRTGDRFSKHNSFGQIVALKAPIGAWETIDRGVIGRCQ